MTESHWSDFAQPVPSTTTSTVAPDIINNDIYDIIIPLIAIALFMVIVLLYFMIRILILCYSRLSSPLIPSKVTESSYQIVRMKSTSKVN